jgi:hypothetical protein
LARLPKVEPFIVFVSSAQQEFEKERKDLQRNINNEGWWSGLNLMEARLIENQRGPVIQDDVRRGLDAASIYVGLFGKELRDWPVAEFRYAKARDLPQLIYRFERRSRPGRPRARKAGGPMSKVEGFLTTEGSGIRIRGLPQPYRNWDVLLETILTDLAIQVAEMVRENTDIRKRFHTGM